MKIVSLQHSWSLVSHESLNVAHAQAPAQPLKLLPMLPQADFRGQPHDIWSSPSPAGGGCSRRSRTGSSRPGASLALAIEAAQAAIDACALMGTSRC